MRSRAMANRGRNEANWPEVMAEVITCRYDVRAGRALAFGLTTKKHFRIAYNYRLGDELHLGECFSERAIPQGSLFPVRVDPDKPHRSANAVDLPLRRAPLLVLGVAGSVLLSLLWLLVMRGCAP